MDSYLSRNKSLVELHTLSAHCTCINVYCIYNTHIDTMYAKCDTHQSSAHYAQTHTHTLCTCDECSYLELKTKKN